MKKTYHGSETNNYSFTTYINNDKICNSIICRPAVEKVGIKL